LPDKPSIAVLPFENMSGDPEQNYFVDGVVKDILTTLSKVPALFVIARYSSFTYKGRAVDVRQVGRELGVNYVVEGSMHKAGNRVRVTAQLVECANGGHLWADRFDGELDDVLNCRTASPRKLLQRLKSPRLKEKLPRSGARGPAARRFTRLFKRLLSCTGILPGKPICRHFESWKQHFKSCRIILPHCFYMA